MTRCLCISEATKDKSIRFTEVAPLVVLAVWTSSNSAPREPDTGQNDDRAGPSSSQTSASNVASASLKRKKSGRELWGLFATVPHAYWQRISKRLPQKRAIASDVYELTPTNSAPTAVEDVPITTRLQALFSRAKNIQLSPAKKQLLDWLNGVGLAALFQQIRAGKCPVEDLVDVLLKITKVQSHLTAKLEAEYDIPGQWKPPASVEKAHLLLACDVANTLSWPQMYAKVAGYALPEFPHLTETGLVIQALLGGKLTYQLLSFFGNEDDDLVNMILSELQSSPTANIAGVKASSQLKKPMSKAAGVVKFADHNLGVASGSRRHTASLGAFQTHLAEAMVKSILKTLRSMKGFSISECRGPAQFLSEKLSGDGSQDHDWLRLLTPDAVEIVGPRLNIFKNLQKLVLGEADVYGLVKGFAEQVKNRQALVSCRSPEEVLNTELLLSETLSALSKLDVMGSKAVAQWLVQAGLRQESMTQWIVASHPIHRCISDQFKKMGYEVTAQDSRIFRLGVKLVTPEAKAQLLQSLQEDLSDHPKLMKDVEEMVKLINYTPLSSEHLPFLSERLREAALCVVDFETGFSQIVERIQHPKRHTINAEALKTKWRSILAAPVSQVPYDPTIVFAAIDENMAVDRGAGGSHDDAAAQSMEIEIVYENIKSASKVKSRGTGTTSAVSSDGSRENRVADRLSKEAMWSLLFSTKPRRDTKILEYLKGTPFVPNLVEILRPHPPAQWPSKGWDYLTSCLTELEGVQKELETLLDSRMPLNSLESRLLSPPPDVHELSERWQFEKPRAGYGDKPTPAVDKEAQLFSVAQHLAALFVESVFGEKLIYQILFCDESDASAATGLLGSLCSTRELMVRSLYAKLRPVSLDRTETLLAGVMQVDPDPISGESTFETRSRLVRILDAVLKTCQGVEEGDVLSGLTTFELSCNEQASSSASSQPSANQGNPKSLLEHYSALRQIFFDVRCDAKQFISNLQHLGPDGCLRMIEVAESLMARGITPTQSSTHDREVAQPVPFPTQESLALLLRVLDEWNAGFDSLRLVESFLNDSRNAYWPRVLQVAREVETITTHLAQWDKPPQPPSPCFPQFNVDRELEFVSTQARISPEHSEAYTESVTRPASAEPLSSEATTGFELIPEAFSEAVFEFCSRSETKASRLNLDAKDVLEFFSLGDRKVIEPVLNGLLFSTTMLEDPSRLVSRLNTVTDKETLESILRDALGEAKRSQATNLLVGEVEAWLSKQYARRI